MNTLVCIKRVADTSEDSLLIRDDATGIREDRLSFVVNEWDTYAVEEALRLKNELGGTVTVLTVGNDDCEEQLRRCLAMGVDEGVLVEYSPPASPNSGTVAALLSATARTIPYDLVLTGVQSSDNGSGRVGVAMATLLDIPFATVVSELEVHDGQLTVTRELEGGLCERLQLPCPALLTIQTGINEPRYVSLLGIRKARKKEIRRLTPTDLGLDVTILESTDAEIESERCFIPRTEIKATILDGEPEDVCSQLLDLLRHGGLI